jgi:hypothetical protein
MENLSQGRVAKLGSRGICIGLEEGKAREWTNQERGMGGGGGRSGL